MKTDITSETLDSLLDQAFLELDFTKAGNEMILQAAASRILLEQGFSGAVKKSMFSCNKLKLLITGIAVFSALITGLILFTGKQEQLQQEQKVLIPEANMTAPSETKQEPVVENFLKATPADHRNKKQPEENTIVTSAVEDTASTLDLHQYEAPQQLKDTAVVKAVTEDSAYVFPTLTEKEIKANNKQKKKMIEQLTRFSKDKYAQVPMGSFNYNNSMVSLYGFYMQCNEVTNLEYRTFLFDLLIQGRKEEFLKAKPDQQQWMKEFNRPFFQPFVDNYFSHVAYNLYPVVNISRQGAEMYCIWLTVEANKVLAEKNKPLINDLRLPTDAEWTYAALGGRAAGDYAWPTPGVRSVRHGCFMGNFCLKKYSGTIDSISKCNPKAYTEAYTTGGLMLGENTFTVPVYSYNPNEYGLYCISGNVAEMVNVCKDLMKPNQHTPGTKGGGWNSGDATIKITGKDEYEGKTTASPFIGFRPVISANRIK